MPQELDK